MKPPAFEYHAPDSVGDAVRLLASYRGDAKVLAGGQSLVPMLNFRLLKPAALIDLNGIRELDFIAEDAGCLRIGALTRHATLASSALVARHFPIIPAVMSHVAHMAIRNRGTIGGSLAHADPAAELPLVARLLDATLVLASSGGRRTVAAADFFLGALTTALEDGEIVTEIRLPYLPGYSFWGFREMALRSGDFAIAAAGVTLALDGEKCTGCRIAVIGSETARRVAAAEELLTDAPMTPDAIAEAARVAAESAAWNSDLHASAEFRRQLVAVLTERALSDARARSRGESP